MMTSWSTVLKQAVAAAEGVLAAEWPVVSRGVEAQIGSLVATAQYIEKNKANMSDDEVKGILKIHKLAVEDVMLIYEDIGIAVAEKATEATWNIVEKALEGAIGAAIKL